MALLTISIKIIVLIMRYVNAGSVWINVSLIFNLTPTPNSIINESPNDDIVSILLSKTPKMEPIPPNNWKKPTVVLYSDKP